MTVEMWNEKVTPARLLTRRAVQLLVTEALSYALLFSARSHGDSMGIHIGLGAPIALILLPIYAIKHTEYLGAYVFFLIDIAFGLVIALSITNRWKWIGGTSLLLFNLAGIMMVISVF